MQRATTVDQSNLFGNSGSLISYPDTNLRSLREMTTPMDGRNIIWRLTGWPNRSRLSPSIISRHIWPNHLDPSDTGLPMNSSWADGGPCMICSSIDAVYFFCTLSGQHSAVRAVQPKAWSPVQCHVQPQGASSSIRKCMERPKKAIVCHIVDCSVLPRRLACPQCELSCSLEHHRRWPEGRSGEGGVDVFWQLHLTLDSLAGSAFCNFLYFLLFLSIFPSASRYYFSTNHNHTNQITE